MFGSRHTDRRSTCGPLGMCSAVASPVRRGSWPAAASGEEAGKNQGARSALTCHVVSLVRS